ncbi:hypothetical protein ABFS83_14G093300 [Erythranthe nasuta]
MKIHHRMKMAPSSSKKLLIPDPKPKSGPAIAPPNSASSSSTNNAPPPEKRTRDQPNLSDCHCCGRRINHTNPNDRLQPMNSFWRIVLLCRKCRKKVQNGKTCPYCFRETGNPGDLFKCTVCGGKIHKDCVRDYENCRPWCYLGAGLDGFRVCVDCWVPDLLKNSTTVSGRSENKGGLKGKCGGKDFLGNSEKKVKMVTEATEQVLRRAKNVVGSEIGKDCPKADDAELAIRLHRAMNSSPRILRGKGLVSSNALDVSNIRDWNGLFYKRSALKNQVDVHKLGACVAGKDSCSDFSGLNRGLIPYKRDKKRKIWCSMESVSAGRSNTFNCVDRFGKELVYYKRTRCKSKQKVRRVDGLVGVSGECSSCDNHSIAFESEYCQSDDAKLRISGVVNSDAEVILPNGSCGAALDRYHWKYVKRVIGAKSGSNFLHSGTLSENQAPPPGLSNFEFFQSDDAKRKTGGPVSSNAEVILQNGSCYSEQDRYHWKYSKRVTGTKSDSSFVHFATFRNENEAAAPDLSDSEYCQLVGDKAEVILPNGSCGAEKDRYHWKYVKRATGAKPDSSFLHYGTFRTENQASARGLSDSEYCRSDDANLRTSCPVSSDAEVILLNGSCNAEKDPYHWKYVKRITGAKSVSSFLHRGTSRSENQASAPCLSDSEYCQPDDANLRTSCPVDSNTEVILPNGNCDSEQDRYHWKYVKRVAGKKSNSIFMHCGTFLSVKQASVQPGLSESEYCQSDDEKKLRTSCPVSSDSEVILPNGSCDAKQDPYHWKYFKRVTGTKSDPRFLHYSTSLSENQTFGLALSSCEAGYSAKCDGQLIMPNGSGNQDHDRYHLKYSKRVKSFKSGSSC